MSILIAESGGTKTDWVLSYQGGMDELQTRGFNPSVTNETTILDMLQGPVSEWLDGRMPEAVYFFGAGLGRPGGRISMRKALRSGLALACPVHVQSDLMGAAYACLGDEIGIVGIMGTGSAAIRFDGQSIVARHGGWGYLIGDEGGGIDLGRTLLRNLVEGNLPESIENAYLEDSGIDREQILHALYTHNSPTQFLAGQVPFLAENQQHPAIKQMLDERMRLFLKTYLLPLVHGPSEKVALMGGVARIFSDKVTHLCGELSLTNVKILRESPIRAITRFLVQRIDPALKKP